MTFLSQAAVPALEVAQHQVELWEQQMNKNDDHNEILSEQQLNNNKILHGLKKQNTTNWFLLCFEDWCLSSVMMVMQLTTVHMWLFGVSTNSCMSQQW